MRRIIVMALSFVLALIVAAPMAAGQNASQDQDLETLSTAWWNWAFENPAETSPLLGDYSGGERCDGSNPTGTWFLAAEFETQENAGGGFKARATRDCTVPAGTELFFPVFNIICSPLFNDDPNDPRWEDKGLPGCAKYYTDQALTDYDPIAKVDGKAVPIERVASGNFDLNFQDGTNFLGADPGTYPAATDGLWVSLPPLPKGKHEVKFGGVFANPFGSGKADLKVIYNLTVK